MIKISGIFIFLVIFTCNVYPLKLPSYIKPCRKSDPNLKKCVMDSTQRAVFGFINGDKKFKIPSLNPLRIPLMEIDSGKDLRLSFHDLSSHGFDVVSVKDANVDFSKSEMTVRGFAPIINFSGQYEVDGKILILPIQGKGNSNISLYDGLYDFKVVWNLENRNGKQYAKIVDSDFGFEIKGAHFQLDNLFNGDKKLGDETNKFLNDNWEEISKDLGKGVAKVFASVAKLITKNVFENVPFNEIFLD